MNLSKKNMELENDMELRKIDPKIQTGIYGTIGTVSLILNVLIVITIMFSRRMRTRSNLLLVNLAFTDMLVIVVGIPLTIYTLNTTDTTHLYGPYCDFTGYLILVVFVTSNFNLTLIAVHRYMLLMQSAFYSKCVTTPKLLFCVFLCWFIPGLIGLAPVLGWSDMQYNFGRVHCMLVWEEDKGYLIFLQLLAFTIPLIIMIFCYFNIIRKTKQSRKRFQSVADEANVLRKALEQKLTIMLLVVVLVFFTCFMPYAILIYTEGFFNIKTSEVYNFVAMLMCYSNSMCEFWIYITMSKKFRLSLKHLFVQKPKESRSRSSTLQNTAEVESYFM